MNDGGPAFPNEYTMSTDDGGRVAPVNVQYGLTIRDYFMAKAMPQVTGYALMSKERAEAIAYSARVLADAMLAERAK